MTLSLQDLAKYMRDIDTCLVATVGTKGLNARPMSNNRDVEWDGTAWFFALDSTGLVKELNADPRAIITYTGERGFWACTAGKARIHSDRDLMKQHWDRDIDRWFKEGVDTEGLRLVEVSGELIRYWTFEDGDGEIDLRGSAA